VSQYTPSDPAGFRDATVRRWLIDTETHLPARVQSLLSFGYRSDYWMDFTYTRLNQPIPEEEFRPPSATGERLTRKELDPLGEGYARRFLNVRDGSDGRMSVRWGMKGPKGTVSSGLN
jgi:hypothetical protein